MTRLSWAGLVASLALAGVLAATAFGWAHGVGRGAERESHRGPGAQPGAQPSATGALPALGATGPVHLLAVGTSLTARRSWPEELAARLAACRPGEVSFEILARPGATSAWGAPALAARLAAGGPERERRRLVVILEFAVNDSVLHKGPPLAVSRRRHRAMVDLVRSVGGVVVLPSMSPAAGRNAWIRAGRPAYEAILAELAADGRALFVDTSTAWAGLPLSERRRLMPDGLHPTAEADRQLLVPALEAALRPALCQAPAGLRETAPPPRDTNARP